MSQEVSRQLFVRVSSALALGTSVLLAIFCMIKIFGIDRDYTRYIYFFEQISLADPDSRHGDGFDALTLAIKLLWGAGSFDFWVFLVALASLLIKLSILSVHRSYLFLFCLYFLIIYPLHEMMQVKAGLASSLAYWGLFLATYSESGILSRLTLLGLSASVHISTLIFAPFILLKKYFLRPSHSLALTIGLVPPFVLNFLFEFLTLIIPALDLYLALLEKEEEVVINPFSSRNITLVTILLLGLWNLKSLPRKALPWFYLSLFGMGLWFGFMWIPVVAHRLLELTVFSYFVWSSYLPKAPRFIAYTGLTLFGLYFFVSAINSYYT